MIQEVQYNHIDDQSQQQDQAEEDQQYGESFGRISLDNYKQYFDKINQALEQSSQLTNQMFADQNFQQNEMTYEEIYNKENIEDKGIDEISKKILEYQLFYGIQNPDEQMIQQATMNQQNLNEQNTFQQNRFELLSQEIANRIQERALVTTDQNNQFNLHTIEEEDINEEDLSIDKKHRVKKIEVHHQQLTESNTDEHQHSNQQEQSSLIQHTQDQINQESSQQDEFEERHSPPMPIPQEEGPRQMIVVKGNRYLIQNYDSNHNQQVDQLRFFAQNNQQQDERTKENEEDELNHFQKIEQQIQLYENQNGNYEEELNYQQQQEDLVDREGQQEENDNLQCDEQQEIENQQQYQLQKQAIEAFVQQQNQQQQVYKENLNQQLITHAGQQQNDIYLADHQEIKQENQQARFNNKQYDDRLTMDELSGNSYQSYRQIKNQRNLNQTNSDRVIPKQYKPRAQSPRNEQNLQKISKQQNLGTQQKQISKQAVLSLNSNSTNYKRLNDQFNAQASSKSPSSTVKNNKKAYSQQTNQHPIDNKFSAQVINSNQSKNIQANDFGNNLNNNFEWQYEERMQDQHNQHFNPSSYLSSYSQNQAQSMYDYQDNQSNQMTHNQNSGNISENEYNYEQRFQNQNNKFSMLQKLQQEKLRLEKIKYKKLIQEQQEEKEKKVIRQNKMNKEYLYNNLQNQTTSISIQNDYFPPKMKTVQDHSNYSNTYYQKNMLTEYQNNSAYIDQQQTNQTYLNSFKMKKKQMSLSNLSNQSENQLQNINQIQQIIAQDSNKYLRKFTSPSSIRSDYKSPQNKSHKDILIQQNQQKSMIKNQQSNNKNEQNIVTIDVMKKIASDIEKQQALKQKKGQIDSNVQREARVLIKNGLVADAINEMVLKADKKSRSTSRTPSKNKKTAPTSKIISQKAKEQQMLRFQHAVVESTDNLKPKKSIQQQRNTSNNYFANYFNESPIKKKSTPNKQSAKDANDRGILMILENFSKKNQVNAKELKLNQSSQSITSRNQLTNKNSSNNSNTSMQLKTLLL